MIDIQNVTFGYQRTVRIFEDFSLKLKPGCIYGLLGKNGTGKSTLLYLITGLLRAQQGKVTFDGNDVARRLPETLQEMFLIPEEVTLPNVNIRQYARMYGPFYPKFSSEQLDNYLKEFEVDPQAKLSDLSMGQRKKAYISFALATNTRFIFMDEPTNGLDIPSKSQFRKIVASTMTDERSIVISTHQVRDLDYLLDHLIIIDQKQLLLNRSVSDITERLCFDELRPNEMSEGGVLFSMPSMNGNSIISRNVNHRETSINLELFFNAMLEKTEMMQDILR